MVVRPVLGIQAVDGDDGMRHVVLVPHHLQSGILLVGSDGVALLVLQVVQMPLQLGSWLGRLQQPPAGLAVPTAASNEWFMVVPSSGWTALLDCGSVGPLKTAAGIKASL